MAKTLTAEDVTKLPYRPCVGLMVMNSDGKVFVGTRLDREYDAWQMPQGGVEKGEDPQTAALRELEEETGIPESAVTVVAQSEDWIPYELPYDLIPRLWSGRFRGQEQKWFLLRFNGSDDLINIATDEPEFAEWKWVDHGELIDNIVPFKRDTYIRVIEAFKEHLVCET